MDSDLDSLSRSYSRLSKDVGGRIEFACDLNSTDALNVAEQEKALLDQAFFVLSFSALEKKITSLASARQSTPNRRARMRSSGFDKRLDTAIRIVREVLGSVPEWASETPTIKNWNAIRNEIAHGDPPTQLFNVPPVISLADAIGTSLDRVVSALSR